MAKTGCLPAPEKNQNTKAPFFTLFATEGRFFTGGRPYALYHCTKPSSATRHLQGKQLVFRRLQQLATLHLRSPVRQENADVHCQAQALTPHRLRGGG